MTLDSRNYDTNSMFLFIEDYTIQIVFIEDYCLSGSTSRRIFSYIMAAMVILLAVYHLLVEVLRMTYSIVAYLKDIRNYFELLLYTSCVIFVFNFATDCGCVLDWQWQLGIFVVFLGWINLIFFASKVPVTGIYVLVFKEILLTFLKLVLFSMLLVIAFSLILYMMFSDPNAMVRISLLAQAQTLTSGV